MSGYLSKRMSASDLVTALDTVHKGEVVVSELVGSTWRRVSGLTWVNGPTRKIVGNTRAGFTGWGVVLASDERVAGGPP